jgi:hypothetical protein
MDAVFYLVLVMISGTGLAAIVITTLIFIAAFASWIAIQAMERVKGLKPICSHFVGQFRLAPPKAFRLRRKAT